MKKLIIAVLLVVVALFALPSFVASSAQAQSYYQHNRSYSNLNRLAVNRVVYNNHGALLVVNGVNQFDYHNSRGFVVDQHGFVFANVHGTFVLCLDSHGRAIVIRDGFLFVVENHQRFAIERSVVIQQFVVRKFVTVNGNVIEVRVPTVRRVFSY